MSNQNIGGISWFVDADTSPAVNSTAELGKQIDKVERDFKGLDTQVSKTAREVGKATSGMRANFGQAGIQMQQFVGQIQGGQSAMLALSQQAADIGIVMGAPMIGVVVALAASFAGMLLPNLFKSTDAIEELEIATKNLEAAFTLSSSGVEKYSEKMKELKKISQGLFEISQKNLLAEQELALTKAANGLDDYVDSYRGLNFELDLFGKRSDEAARTFIRLSDATAKFKGNRTAENLKLVEDALSAATDAGLSNTEAGQGLINNAVALSVAFHKGAKRAEQLADSIKNGTDATDFAGSAAADYSDELARLEIRSEKTRSAQLALEKQAALNKAAEDGVSESMRQSIATQYDKLIANAKLEESERDKTKAARQSAKEQAEIDKKARDAERKRREQERQREKQSQKLDRFNSMANSAIAAAEDDPEVLATIARDTKLEDLRKAYMESDLADSARFAEASKAIWQKYNDDLVSINEHRTMTTLASFQGTFDSLAQVFKDAEGEQSASFRAMFAMSKGFAIAQAGLNLSKAISDALGWGGFTIAEKFASMGAVSAAGAGLLSSITSASYGGREHGGTVMANTPYSVGEKNKPELLIIPGSNGKVFSNAEMRSFANGGGGGGAPIVNVHNYAGVPVETRTSQGMTEQQVIDIIIGQTSSGNTRAMKNITRLTSATNNAAANRR